VTTTEAEQGRRPFTTRIPEEKQDKHLEMKLREKGSGILNWLIEAMR
jgi:phage/plasmid-associated DNA primase